MKQTSTVIIVLSTKTHCSTFTPEALLKKILLISQRFSLFGSKLFSIVSKKETYTLFHIKAFWQIIGMVYMKYTKKIVLSALFLVKSFTLRWWNFFSFLRYNCFVQWLWLFKSRQMMKNFFNRLNADLIPTSSTLYM